MLFCFVFLAEIWVRDIWPNNNYDGNISDDDDDDDDNDDNDDDDEAYDDFDDSPWEISHVASTI